MKHLILARHYKRSTFSGVGGGLQRRGHSLGVWGWLHGGSTGRPSAIKAGLMRSLSPEGDDVPLPIPSLLIAAPIPTPVTQGGPGFTD